MTQQFDINAIKEIGKQLGLKVEFGSARPGIQAGDTFFSWDAITEDVNRLFGSLEPVPAPKHYYEICFFGSGHPDEWNFYIESRKPLSKEEVEQVLRMEHIGVDGLTIDLMKHINYVQEISVEEYAECRGLELSEVTGSLDQTGKAGGVNLEPVLPAVLTGTLVRLTRERRSESRSWTDEFLADASVKNPEDALRQAVADYLKTVEGREAVVESCEDFNWGDAIQEVPDAFWNRHGLHFLYNDKQQQRLITGETIEIIVNQDELLFDDDLFDEGV